MHQYYSAQKHHHRIFNLAAGSNMKILPFIFFMAVSIVRGAFAATGSAVEGNMQTVSISVLRIHRDHVCESAEHTDSDRIVNHRLADIGMWQFSTAHFSKTRRSCSMR
jgi:hypothetical protein